MNSNIYEKINEIDNLADLENDDVEVSEEEKKQHNGVI